jgi:hypothetical protein
VLFSNGTGPLHVSIFIRRTVLPAPLRLQQVGSQIQHLLQVLRETHCLCKDAYGCIKSAPITLDAEYAHTAPVTNLI